MKERVSVTFVRIPALSKDWRTRCLDCIFVDREEGMCLRPESLKCLPNTIFNYPAYSNDNKEDWVYDLKLEMLHLGWEQQVVGHMDYDSYWEFYSHLTPYEALMEDMSYGDE